MGGFLAGVESLSLSSREREDFQYLSGEGSEDDVVRMGRDVVLVSRIREGYDERAFFGTPIEKLAQLCPSANRGYGDGDPLDHQGQV
jgi:hypothetical protein